MEKESKKKKKRVNNQPNSQPSKRERIYFQKQKHGCHCRLHALNNALGRSALSRRTFFAYCDEFDKVFQKYCKMNDHLKTYNCEGSRNYFFLSVDEDANVLSFILHKMKFTTQYYPLNGSIKLTPDLLEDCESFLCWSEGHVWAYRCALICNRGIIDSYIKTHISVCRKYGNTWYCLDSLQSVPTPIKPHKLGRQLGYIIIKKAPPQEQEGEAGDEEDQPKENENEGGEKEEPGKEDENKKPKDTTSADASDLYTIGATEEEERENIRRRREAKKKKGQEAKQEREGDKKEKRPKEKEEKRT